MREELMNNQFGQGIGYTSGSQPFLQRYLENAATMGEDTTTMLGKSAATITSGSQPFLQRYMENAATMLGFGDQVLGIDRQRLNNANTIASNKLNDATSRFTGNQLNTGGRSNSQSANDRTQSDLDRLVASLGSFFSNMSQPQNSNMSASDIIGINNNAIDKTAEVGRTALFDRAVIDRDAQILQQGFNVKNAKLADSIAQSQAKLRNNLDMRSDMQSRLMDLNEINQNTENAKELNKQQMYDNQNARQYELNNNIINNVAGIYQNSKAKDLLQQIIG